VEFCTAVGIDSISSLAVLPTTVAPEPYGAVFAPALPVLRVLLASNTTTVLEAVTGTSIAAIVVAEGRGTSAKNNAPPTVAVLAVNVDDVIIHSATAVRLKIRRQPPRFAVLLMNDDDVMVEL